MSSKFHELQIKKIVRETPDCVSVSFSVPEHIAQQYLYKEGQNITIRYNLNGEELRRTYSVCMAPHENELKVAIKKIAGGVFSGLANQSFKVGDLLQVMPPSGTFNASKKQNTSGNYLAIAAGSGITPVISIIKHLLHTEPNCTFTLVYGNRSRADIIFFEELEGLKNRYMERFNIIHVLSREKTDADLNFGRIDVKKLEQLEKVISYKNLTDVWLCGPADLIFNAKDFLIAQGVEESNIHFELFNTAGIKVQQVGNVADDISSTNSDVTIKLDGRSMSFKLGAQANSILDAALSHGADLPYACKGGVCATCKAKVVSGEVRMDVNYALEPDEVEKGFILTCQSHPVSSEVVIDFDQKF